MNVLLHAAPLFIADGDAAVPPLVVVAPLFRVAQYLLGILQRRDTYHPESRKCIRVGVCIAV